MQLFPFFFLAGTFATAVLAGDVDSLDSPHGTIVFCNEANYMGDCSANMNFDWRSCYVLPDSNAKGDKGSSYFTTDGQSRCILHTGPNCTGIQSKPHKRERYLQADVTFRTFRCQRGGLPYLTDV